MIKIYAFTIACDKGGSIRARKDFFFDRRHTFPPAFYSERLLNCAGDEPKYFRNST